MIQWHRVVRGVLAPLMVVGASFLIGPMSSASGSTLQLTSASKSAFSDAQEQRFQMVLNEARASFKFPGVQAGIWSPTGTWIGRSGTRGPGQDAPPALSDHTRIGSVTKTFTVTALLQLVEKSRLSLKDPISCYVKGIPNGSATLGELANMTSGIPSYTANPAFQEALFANPTRPWSPQQLVNIIRGTKPDFAPGKGWEYSNTNTVLLGMVIQKVTKEPIATVFEDQILRPLHLNQTFFITNSPALPAPHLSGVTEQGQPAGSSANATNWNPSWAFTAGSMVSNLNDLHRWGVALGTGVGILTPAMEKIRQDSIIRDIPPNTAERGYGYGIGDANGWWGHTGELPGFNTVVMYNVKSRTTIVVMVNSDIAVDGKNPAPAVFQGLVRELTSAPTAAK